MQLQKQQNFNAPMPHSTMPLTPSGNFFTKDAKENDVERNNHGENNFAKTIYNMLKKHEMNRAIPTNNNSRK